MTAIEILSWPFLQESINQINNKEQYLNYPVIYVLNGNKEAYIGETVYFKNRMKVHLKARKNIKQVNLIKHESPLIGKIMMINYVYIYISFFSI